MPTNKRAAHYIVSLSIDHLTDKATVLRSDGQVFTFPARFGPAQATSRIRITAHLPTANLFFIQTTKGHYIAAELPTVTDQPPRRGRPVIYLDQRDWSTIAKAIHTPKRVTPAQRNAALAIIDLALDRKILLPFSSAHMSETCQWEDAEARYRLGLTILQLSAGWQMRDPLAVRHDEIHASFERCHVGKASAQPSVFTLAPNAILASRTGVSDLRAPNALPSDMQLAFRAIVTISANFDTILDGEHVGMTPTPGWVEHQRAFTAHLGSMRADSRQKSKLINTFFLGDTQLELARAAATAGISVSVFENWLHKQSNVEIAAMPALGLFREVMREKHLNPGAKWEQNDLTDMMYLTCGAAYADFVVCESPHGSALRKSLKRLGRPSNVMRSLEELVDQLSQADGHTT